jgi:hypothetical protein
MHHYSIFSEDVSAEHPKLLVLRTGDQALEQIRANASSLAIRSNDDRDLRYIWSNQATMPNSCDGLSIINCQSNLRIVFIKPEDTP